MNVKCNVCGQGTLKKKTQQKHGCVTAVAGMSFGITGFALCFTIVGAVVGVPLMIAAFFMMATERVLVCSNCGQKMSRA